MKQGSAVGWALIGAFVASVSCGGGNNFSGPKGFGLSCTADKDCAAYELLCSDDSKCVQCLSESDCKPTESCSAGLCKTPTQCNDSRDCSSDQVCQETYGLCVDCITSKDCTGGTVCRQNKCADQATCDFTSDCTDGLLCDAKQHLCVTCRNDKDCGLKQVCTDNECVSEASNGGSGSGGTSSTGGKASGGGGGKVTAGTDAGGTDAGGTNLGGVGGASGSGGSGGKAGSGGGGQAGSGGSGGNGGNGGNGGSGGSGGSGGAAGATCGASWAVSSTGFVTSPGDGGSCWHGHAFAGADADSVASPTEYTACGTPCLLCVAGSVSTSLASAAFVGFNLNQQSVGLANPVIPKGAGLEVTFTNSLSAPLRVQISSGATRWCATVTTSPAAIPYSSFNTECWAGGLGAYYARQAIDSVELVVPSSPAKVTPFNVCLTGAWDL